MRGLLRTSNSRREVRVVHELFADFRSSMCQYAAHPVLMDTVAR